jgi:hypothetical protein
MASITNGNIAQRFKQRFDSIQTRLGQKLKDIIAQIELRASRGKGINGEALAPYSPAYRDYKKSAGRTGKKKSVGRTGKVDLTFTGKMLGSMTSAVIREGKSTVGRIFFPSDQVEKVINNQRKRRFFGLAKEQRDSLKKVIAEIIRGR